MAKHFLQRGAKRRLLAVSGLTGLLGLSGVVAGLIGAGRAAHARDILPTLSIFQGLPAQASGLTLGSWGSGSITEDPKTSYTGTESLRVITHGQFQGASLRLSKPVDLGSFVADKSAYLQIVALIPAPSGAGSSGPGGFGPPGSNGGLGTPGGFGPPNSNGGGGKLGGATATTKAKAIENVRVALIRANGRGTEVTLPIASGGFDNQWRLLSIPVASLPGVTATNAKFSEIRLFGDNPGVMYVGRIGVVVDPTPLKVDAVSDMIVEFKKRYRYTANATAGATPLKYSWDWDNADGVQEESIGRTVEHIYYKEGDFVGSVTVSDVYGLKPPVTVKFKVHAHQ